jgi:hypothetical protein
MDYVQILRRAGEITWRYRVLWVFGIILALVSGGGGGGGFRGYSFSGGDFPGPRGDFPVPRMPEEVMSGLIAAAVALACLGLILLVVFTIARYVATSALIRLVNDYEAVGERRSVGQGFRLGWSRSSFRLFLIDLLIGIPAAIVFLLLLAIAAAPLLLWVTDSEAAGIVGTLAAIGLFIVILLLIIVASAVLVLLRHFFQRACVLEERGVIDSIREGYGLIRRRLKDVLIMWLIMIGVGLGLGIVTFIVTLLLLALGAVFGGVPGVLAGLLASTVSEGALPWLIGAVVGLPIFLLVVAVPSLFLGGLIEVFKSSVWTLAYRAVRGVETA